MDWSAGVEQSTGSDALATVTEAVYSVYDGWVVGHGLFTVGTNLIGSFEIWLKSVTLPQPLSSYAGECIGTWRYFRSASRRYSGGDLVWNGTNVRFYVHSTSTTTALGSNPAATPNTNDTLALRFRYRHA